jgi:outer membrane protein assembly factor BamA
MWARLLATALVLSLSAAGQPPATRAEALQREAEQREPQLKPETTNKWEDRLRRVRDEKIVERLLQGYNGLSIRLGGMPPGAGFAFGPQWQRLDLAKGRVVPSASVQTTFTNSQKYELGLRFPRSEKTPIIADVLAVHRNYNNIPFYGIGPDSTKGGRTAFHYEDTSFDGRLGLALGKYATVAGSVGYALFNVGPGDHDDWSSITDVFTPAQVPGLNEQTNYLRYGGAFLIDYLDNPAGPRRGGSYAAQYTFYDDRKLQRYDFNQLDVELRQYIPFFNERRIIALRGRTTLTDPSGNGTTPFYLMPMIGGGNDLRGFRPFRFTGPNSLILNGEYIWEIFAGLDMAAFVDAGKVFRRHSQLNFHDLESSVGFGFRANARNQVFMRLDVAFSHEGWQLWFNFGPLLRPIVRGSAYTQPLP